MTDSGGVPGLPDTRGWGLALHHRTHSADKLVNAHSELVDAPVRLDTTLSKSNHRLIEAFDVVSQLIDTPRERTHNRFEPSQALIVFGLIAQQKFNGFLDVHLDSEYCKTVELGAGAGRP